jgi:hypothetical protein
MNRPFPLPSDLGLRKPVAQPLVRAILATAHASYTGDRDVRRVVKQMWPDDKATLALVTRAASAPARTDVSGWAAELAINTIAELLVALGPQSAGSQLLRRATVLTLGRYESVTVPALVAAATNASFVGQGGAIPFRQIDTSKSAKLEPRKLATGFSLTREMINSSNAEQLVRMVLINSLALSLDAVLFSNAAGSPVAPPGLLAGITPLGATTGGGSAAMVADIAALAGAVAPIGALDLVFIASPAEAVKILLTAGPHFAFPVFASGALAATKTVICVAPVAVVAAADSTPEIMETRTALVHHDTAPTDITGGTPSPAVPVRSTFQTDTSAFRLILDLDWALLNAGAIAVVSGVTW